MDARRWWWRLGSIVVLLSGTATDCRSGQWPGLEPLGHAHDVGQLGDRHDAHDGPVVVSRRTCQAYCSAALSPAGKGQSIMHV